ncbi:MAG TPA: efflux RND transporter periplasmic adaptor subunit [Tepidisphaeraceae bacterium]|jgi:RND family efflux transporter MFP subunit|nr:efflux RND transporter periplasmic adaptor subunit [Tepidisphaeraceae bacterium]
MHLRSLIPSVTLAVLLAGLPAHAQYAQPQSSSADKSDLVVIAITQPSDRRQLSFEQRGLIREESVKEGQSVKKDQKLLVQDDRSDRAQWQSLKLQGDSTLEVEYAQKDQAVKESTLKRIEGMAQQNAAPISEVEEARLAAERSATQVKLAAQEKEQKKDEAAAKGFLVENMTLVSPIDGVVEKILNRVGETTNPEPDHPSIIVVQNDPLWVIMYLPNRQVDQIKPDDSFAIRYNDKQPWKSAKVQFISPTADAKSFTRLVRLEVPNPEMVAGGHEVQVRLPQQLAQQAADPGVASALK